MAVQSYRRGGASVGTDWAWAGAGAEAGTGRGRRWGRRPVQGGGGGGGWYRAGAEVGAEAGTGRGRGRRRGSLTAELSQMQRLPGRR